MVTNYYEQFFEAKEQQMNKIYEKQNKAKQSKGTE